MNSQVKMALIPYDELRKRQEDEATTSKSYSDVLSSDLQNNIKVRILNDIINKFLERKLKSESFLESLFEPKDPPEKVKTVRLKTRKRAVRKPKTFRSTASSPFTAQLSQSDLLEKTAEAESIVEERPVKKKFDETCSIYSNDKVSKKDASKEIDERASSLDATYKTNV